MTGLLRLIPLCAMTIVAVISIAVTFRRLSAGTITWRGGWEIAPAWLRELGSKNYLLAYAVLWLLGTLAGMLIVLAVAFATGRGVSFNFFAYMIGGALGLVVLEIAWLVYSRPSQLR